MKLLLAITLLILVTNVKAQDTRDIAVDTQEIERCNEMVLELGSQAAVLKIAPSCKGKFYDN